MPTQQVSLPDLPSVVQAVFATRPTLRQVAGEQLMAIIVAHYPLLAVHRPTLRSAEPLFLMRPQPDGGWHSVSLVEVLLQAMLDATALDFSDVGGLDCRFSLQPPHRFFAIDSPFETAEGDVIRPRDLEAKFNQLLPLLHERFCEAQVRFWNGEHDDFDRSLWLQQMLRLSMFDGLRSEALDADQRDCLQDMLLGKFDGFSVQAVRVALEGANGRFNEVLPNLLVTASNEVRTLRLWCSPAGEVRSFESQEAFTAALQGEIGLLYRFDDLALELLDGEEDPFDMQVALILEYQLQCLAKVRRSDARDVEQLVAMYAQACEPSHWFAAGRQPASTAAVVKLPGKLKRAEKNEQTAYAQAMIDLAVLQAGCGGGYALEGVDDLHTYAARRLREEMLTEHPIDANYFADDLLLTVDTFVNDQHGLGFGQKIDSKQISLTELAIGRLDATGTGVVTAISHRDNQLIMDWLTVDYVRGLVDRVDIASTYPPYVNARLGNGDEREQRLARFSGQWRLTLHFDAARARITKAIDEAAYRHLTRFCRRGQASISLSPLAFKRSPTSERVDQVHGMYIIRLDDPSVLLLYTPLYTHHALKQYADAKALLADISAAGNLQDAVLMWMEQSQRAIYDNGGFKEPHLPHWVFDPFAPLDKPAPVELVTRWRAQRLDAFMFESRRMLMIELADRSAMSNSQQRWALIKAFAWELLNAAWPVLPGPVNSIAWLYAGVRGLIDDVQGLANGDVTRSIEAVVDILNNTLMALIHLQLPVVQTGAQRVVANRGGRHALPAGDGLNAASATPPTPRNAGPISTLQPGVDTALDFSWRGAGGVNGLSPAQRGRLRELVSDVSVTGRSPERYGASAGLYRVRGRYYALLAYDVYEVQLDEEGARVVGPDQVAGPELVNDNGNWRIRAGLYGGAGRGPARLLTRQKFEARITRCMADLDRHLAAANLAISHYRAQATEIAGLQATLEKLDLKLQQPPPSDPGKLEQYQAAQQLYLRKQQDLKTQLRLERGKRLGMVAQLYKDYLGAEQAVLALLDNPSFVRSTGQATAARRTLVEVRQNIIGFGMFIIDEVLAYGEFGRYQTVVDELNASPPDQRVERYRGYISVLESIVADQPKIIEASVHLDRLLAVVDANLQIPYGNDSLSLAGVIARRQASTVAIRFFQAMNLADLGLQLRKKINARFLTFRHALASERLRVAANTHHLSLHCELPVAERIEILQTAWDEYVAALLNSERLKGLGDMLVNTEHLEAYKQQMIELRSLAAHALIEAMREQASGQAVAQRHVYPRKALQVARTGEGQIVIGVQTVVDGKPVLQVTAALSNEVSHSFHRESGAWIEDVPTPQAPTELPQTSPEIEARTTALAEGLLANNDEVLERARHMVEQDADDRGLVDLLDGQISDLGGLADQLPVGDASKPLRVELQGAMSRLREYKISLLTELYINTRYPKAQGLAFLHEQDLVSVDYVGPRRKDTNGFLDEYRVSLKSRQGKKARPLWAAHFHFVDAQAAPTAFRKGHLKLWSQRFQGYKDQMVAADAGQVLRIYRGDLTYAQARNIIPFDELR